MKRVTIFSLLICAITTAAIAGAAPRNSKQYSREKEKTPEKYASTGISKADLPRIRKRGVIRVLVSYNQTNYFQIESGREYGFEYELLKQYEKYLNRRISRRRVPVHMVFVPVHFKDLLPALLRGRGDIAAAGLTITKDRAARVAFSRPYLPNVSEIIVSHKGAKSLGAIKDLSGRKVYVLRSSSYAEHLRRLNKKLRSKWRSPIKIIEADPYLQTEDILEMVNAGILDYTVADDHLARILPTLVLHSRIKVKEGSQIAWAVRPKNRRLLRSINSFLKKKKQGTVFGNLVFRRYFKNVKWVKIRLNSAQERSSKGLIDF